MEEPDEALPPYPSLLQEDLLLKFSLNGEDLGIKSIDENLKKSLACILLGLNTFDKEFLDVCFTYINLSTEEINEIFLAIDKDQNINLDAFVCKFEDDALKWEIVYDLMLLSLCSGEYLPKTRVGLNRITTLFGIEWSRLVATESGLCYQIKEQYTTLNDNDENANLQETKSNARWWKIGAATIVGGTVLAITGGLAAPAVVAGLGAIGATGLGAGLASTTGIAVLSSLFGISGAGLAGFKTANLTNGLSQFEFSLHKLCQQKVSGNVLICIDGYIMKKKNKYDCWNNIPQEDPFTQPFILEWESDILNKLGKAFKYFIAEQVGFTGATQIALNTSLSALASSLVWPASLLGSASIIDNPWHLCMDRAEKAGKLLATVLTNRVQGKRPVSLIGYSLGAKMISVCLQELEKKKEYNIIENVFIIGGAITGDLELWKTMKKVVSGRLVNCYSKTDWILAFFYRAVNLNVTVAGLSSIDLECVENIDLSQLISGHMQYEKQMPKILNEIDLISNVTKENNRIISNTKNEKNLITDSLQVFKGHKRKPSTGAVQNL